MYQNSDLSEFHSDDLRQELERRGELTDRIVYCVVTKAGGVDGLDRSAKGGDIKFASFDKAEAAGQVDGWSALEARVLDTIEARKVALAKLDALDQLVLGCRPAPEPKATKRIR